MYHHKKHHFVLLFVLCTLCVVALAGCGNKMQDNQPNQNQSGNAMMPETNNQAQNSRSMDNTTNGNNGTDLSSNDMSAQGNNLDQKGKEISETIVREISEVKDARVILMGNSAYVALDIEDTADTTKASQLKEKVSSLIKENYSQITTVYVTEDADTFTRFGEIAADIADGKPISGFMDEIENFFTRVTPTT